MRTWLHHRWGRGLEIEAAPLQRCSQTPLLDNAIVKRLPFGLSPLRNSLKAASLQCDSQKVPSHRGATLNCLHISLFPLFLSLTQKPLSHSPHIRTLPFVLFRPSPRQINPFFRHHRGRPWYRHQLVFNDPRGTIFRCSTTGFSVLFPDNRASRRNANGSARTSPARALCH
jgi:hypothetical protein